MEDCDPTEKEFQIAIMKKLNTLQENWERQYDDLWNKIDE